MTVPNPCPCGISLRSGIKIVAAINLALAAAILLMGIILTIILITAAVVVADGGLTNSIELNGNTANSIELYGKTANSTDISPIVPATILGLAGIAFFILCCVFGGFSIALALLLWAGIIKRSVPLLSIWFYVTLVLTGLAAGGTIVQLIFNPDVVNIVSTVGLALDVYFLWVAYAYTAELRQIRIVQLQTERKF